MVEIDRRLGMPLVDQPDRGFEGGEIAQAQEVHLQEPGFLDVPHLPLSGDNLLGLVLVGDLLERHQLLERPVGDHHARGVGADTAVHPLEPAGELQQPGNLEILLGHPSQRGLFLQCLFDRDIQPRRAPAC